MSNSNLQVANTILEQLGNGALRMLGAHSLMGSKDGVTIRIRGSKAANAIAITLDPSDTYTMKFMKLGRASVKTVAEHSFVYADQMKKLIESETGLYTSL